MISGAGLPVTASQLITSNYYTVSQVNVLAAVSLAGEYYGVNTLDSLAIEDSPLISLPFKPKSARFYASHTGFQELTDGVSTTYRPIGPFLDDISVSITNLFERNWSSGASNKTGPVMHLGPGDVQEEFLLGNLAYTGHYRAPGVPAGFGAITAGAITVLQFLVFEFYADKISA